MKRNAFASYLGSFYLTLVNLIAVPYYIILLGSEVFGLIGFFAMLQGWLHIFDLGMSPTLSREMAKFKAGDLHPSELRSLVRSLEYFFITIAALVLFIYFLSIEWVVIKWLNIENLKYQEVYFSVLLMGLTIPLRWVQSLYRSGLTGLEEHIWLNKFNMLFATLKAFGAITVLITIERSPIAFFGYQTLLCLIETGLLINYFYLNLPPIEFRSAFSFSQLKRILPFAGSIAFTSIVWSFVSKTDKLILSNSLSLKQYGFFTIAITVAEVVNLFTRPIAKVLLPRMTFLLAKSDEQGMKALYQKSTQFIAVLTCSFAGMIAFFAQPLLYAWLGEKESSIAAAPVLFWYALGNGVLAVMAFQYYLQYAYGILKYHVRFNILFAFIWIPAVFYVASNYGAVATGKLWFSCQLLFFVVWTWFIHNKLTPGLHKSWVLQDIAPVVITSAIYLFLLKSLSIDFYVFSRPIIFGILIILGVFMLAINSLASKHCRMLIFYYVTKGNNED